MPKCGITAIAMPAYQRIGEILVEKGLITQAQLEEAMVERGDTYFRLGEVLVSKGWLTEEGLLSCLAEQYHLPVIDLEMTCPDIDAVEIFGFGYCIARHFLPINKKGSVLTCAVANPLDGAIFSAIEDAHEVRLDIVLATPTAIIKAVERMIVANRPAA